MSWRIYGTMCIHELNITLPFVFQDGTITLGVDLTIADAEYNIAAHIVAREFERPVVWQDIGGTKHRVSAIDSIEPFESLLDPRSVARPDGTALN